MSFYNLLFGVNPHTDIILALIGLKRCDIERFRDCGIDFNDKKIWVYTRTGGGNREDYPNILLTTNPYYLYDEDDDFDTTYATFYFRFPQDIEEDIMALKDPCKYGISGKLINWVLRTLNREPTENDKFSAAYDAQYKLVRELCADQSAVVFNGHTVVPLNDSAMDRLLRKAEENNGEFIAYLIRPYNLIIKTDCPRWSFERNKPELEREMARVLFKTDWRVNQDVWDRYIAKFKNKYPKAISRLYEEINGTLEK